MIKVFITCLTCIKALYTFAISIRCERTLSFSFLFHYIYQRYDILGARYIPCKMMRAVLTHPLFTVKTQYVQSFLKPWNVVIKETNTSLPYWLSSLFFSLKSLIFSRKNGSETRIYLTGDFPPLEPTRSHIPKIPLKHSLSQNCWDTFVSPCPLNVGVQGLVTEPR